MSVYLPRDLFPQIHYDENVNPASRRKVVLPRVTRQVLENHGYKFGNKIRVPGGYAYEVTDPSGRDLNIGLKTAVNRWLNTATTLVEMVDEVIVATFTWDDEGEKPLAFELIKISSANLLKMIAKVRKEAGRREMDPTGHYYMPLDDDLMIDDHIGCVAGSVISSGSVLFGPEKVKWTKDEWGRIDLAGAAAVEAATASPIATPPLDVGALVARTKADLASSLGVPIENIDLSIRF